jgi:hypothetical protein
MIKIFLEKISVLFEHQYCHSLMREGKQFREFYKQMHIVHLFCVVTLLLLEVISQAVEQVSGQLTPLVFHRPLLVSFDENVLFQSQMIWDSFPINITVASICYHTYSY